ncbi:MAG: serine/threonine-protein kinase [Myxococcota bacterium]|jgi:tetratricopeptide (TPR) repeat protein|nr:serine/threonine-protein kinase [Myxococcota bacterium]
MPLELTPSWFLHLDWTGAATHRRNTAERFELVSPLGVGGFGEVWRALDTATGEHVAIKVLGHALARSPQFQSAFRNEIRITSRLAHEGVVRIVDVGTLGAEVERASGGRLVGGSPFVAMELLGPTLASTVRGGCSWERARVVAEQLLRALAHVHARGVVHLDLKPSNVMFRGSGAETRAVLSDFGIAWLATDAGASSGVGTPGYAAPEQSLAEGRNIGPWSDLYAFGCVMWELLAGESPFAVASPIERLFAAPRPFRPRTEVPEGVEAWLRSLLDPSPASRCPSAGRALSELEHGPRSVSTGALPPCPIGAEPFHAAGLGLVGVSAPPFVGRARERELVWAAADDVARSRRPRTVAIVGPTGAGSTRLAEWITEHLAELDAFDVLSVHGSRGEDLRATLRRHFRLEGLSFRRAVSALGAVEPWLAHASAECLLDDSSDPDVLRRLVDAIARQRPVVVVADRADVPMFSAAVLTIRTSREPVVADVVIEVGELDSGAIDELLARLRLGPIAQGVLVADTSRRPGEIVARIAAWAERGQLKRRGDVIDLVPGETAVRSRFDGFALRMTEAELRALEVAAFLAPRVELSVWRAAAEACGAPPSWASLDRLTADGLAEVVDGCLFFAADDIVEALRQRASWRTPAAHRACAAALEAHPSAHRRDERIAAHLLAVDEREAAVEPLVRAAYARVRALDSARARELVEEAVQLASMLPWSEDDPRRVRVSLLAAVERRAAGDLDGAEAHARRAHGAATRARQNHELARAAHLRARVARARGDVTQAMQLFLQAEDAAQRAGDVPFLGDVRLDLAQLLLETHAIREAERELLRVAREHVDPDARRMATVLRARAARVRRDWDEARELVGTVLRAADSRRAVMASALQEAGLVELCAGCAEAARLRLTDALEAHVALGTREVPHLELALAWADVELGDPERARTGIEGARAGFSARGEHLEVERVVIVEAWLEARDGDWERAERLLERETSRAVDGWLVELHERFVAHAEAASRVRLVELLRGQTVGPR